MEISSFPPNATPRQRARAAAGRSPRGKVAAVAAPAAVLAVPTTYQRANQKKMSQRGNITKEKKSRGKVDITTAWSRVLA
ncbi:hypothetical protein I7I50_04487 [Histoplasma capsulatum G186AR]|uniref:Uncharacterized protein n=1 Tax=Ajellomyces capsulatus TaxID=5037 RepID=A0A8H8CY02_AJECA|nr:hypothetical protein I7I52_05396 [Histoplasma capsulatum]QSS75366.1 hypothetical protein I7I50_04487 [Histoplasma capsulatum G186AR]